MWSWIGKRGGFVVAFIYIAQIIYCHFNKKCSAGRLVSFYSETKRPRFTQTLSRDVTAAVGLVISHLSLGHTQGVKDGMRKVEECQEGKIPLLRLFLERTRAQTEPYQFQDNRISS